jgi:tRNA nucleotidyltransferase/poly(A) polymerase
MADYIYTMESRLTPDQQRGVMLVQEIARAAGMNVYLSGGAVRDMISGLTIRDLDFTVQGNPLKLQKELEKGGAHVVGSDDELKLLHLTLPGRVRAEVALARTERFDKIGKPPVIAPATMIEDLRRRDFTANAMALSLNPGSRGLLMDPFNGVADIELKLLRILHNYSFVEDPSRLIRATRLTARFTWALEERTQARYESAKENKYIEYLSDKAIGYETAQLAYEEDPLTVVRALEKEGWLQVLHSHWTLAKIDTASLTELLKTRQQMTDLGYTTDPSAAVMHFLTARFGPKDIADVRKHMPRKDLIEAWRNLDEDAKALGKRLSGKEAATPSRTWKLLSEARPELVMYLDVTAKQQAVSNKIKNFFTKWREVQQRVPLPEMTELRITPSLPEYPKIAHEVFMLLLDGKLKSQPEILKFLKPLAPPPPPPPPPPPAKRGRGAKAAAAAAVQPPVATETAAVPAKKGRGRKAAVAPAAQAPAPMAAPAKPVAPTPAPKLKTTPVKAKATAKTKKAEKAKPHKAPVKKAKKKH